MTTAAEKVAIDVMFAALDAVTKHEPRPGSKKLTMLLGLVVHICHDNNIPEDLLIDLLRNRYREYSLRFEHSDEP